MEWTLPKMESTSGGAESVPPGSGPWISRQPESRSVRAGDTAVFVAIAAGSGQLAYEWFFDGEPVEGATEPVLSLADVTLADQGSYEVAVTNDHGSVTSEAVILTVEGSAELSIP